MCVCVCVCVCVDTSHLITIKRFITSHNYFENLLEMPVKFCIQDLYSPNLVELSTENTILGCF